MQPGVGCQPRDSRERFEESVTGEGTSVKAKSGEPVAEHTNKILLKHLVLLFRRRYGNRLQHSDPAGRAFIVGSDEAERAALGVD